MSCEGKNASYFPTERMIRRKTPQEVRLASARSFYLKGKVIVFTFVCLTKVLEGSLIDLATDNLSKCLS